MGSSTRSSRAAPEPDAATQVTRRRYDRIAPIYDALDGLMERRATTWRQALWRAVQGRDILEVGVGTGKNLPYHPAEANVVAIDLSARMLARARRRAAALGSSAQLTVADVQHLPYADASFDAVVATFVFCSVPDPLRGLQEVRRVLRPGGRLYLLEHVLSAQPLLRRLQCWLDPVSYAIWGAHIDRETAQNLWRSGFSGVQVTPLALDVVVRIEALRQA